MSPGFSAPFLLGLAFLAGTATAGIASRPPNVIIFLANDAGWGDNGFTGNRLASTPHIDRLARAVRASGERFKEGEGLMPGWSSSTGQRPRRT